MYREEKSRKFVDLLISAALTVAAALVVLLKIGIIFETNDDAMLRNIVSGSFTGKPDAHLIYIMYPLGLIFKSLYTVFSNVHWYDLFIVGMHFVCLFLIIFRVASLFKNIFNRIAGIFVTFAGFLILELEYAAVNQYTELAGLMAATAVLYLGTHDYRKKSKTDVVVTILLAIFTLWLRKEVFFLALPPAFLVLVLSIFETNDTMDDRFGRFKKMIPPVAVMLVLVIVSFVAEAVAYSSEEWKNFKAYNEARTKVYDYNLLADYETNADLYEELGIDEAQYTALREYDIAIVSADTKAFEAIAERSENIAKEWAKYYSVPRKILNDTVATVFDSAKKPVALVFYIASMVLLMFCLVTDDRLSGLFTVSSVLYCWAFLGYFTYKGRLPERVTQGFFLLETAFLLVIYLRMVMKSKNGKIPSVFWEILLGLFAVLFLGILCLNSYKRAVDAYEEKSIITERWIEINKYFKANQNNVYVLNNSVYAASGDVLFTEGTTDSYNVITSNWTLGGPLQEARVTRLIDTSVKDALAFNETVFFVQLSGKDTEWLEKYFGSAFVTDTVTVFDGTQYDIISVGK